MKTNSGKMILGAALLALAAAGCAQNDSAPLPVINVKAYTVTPDAMTVMAGIVSGEVTEMQVAESIEEGTGRITSPARLTGKLVLSNSSTDQSVRLLEGRFVYIGTDGAPIKLGDDRTESTLRLAPSYGASDRLDPGQNVSHTLDANFPIEALKQQTLKEIRLELDYIPSSFKMETLSFPVSIAAK